MEFSIKLDITPGSCYLFSDFKFFAFPGIDVGYQLLDNVKHMVIGYTYRINFYRFEL
jgi:iron complex outermembrane receptor protein